jgi:hypothetical protein
MWECLHCGESVAEVFAVCWKCQANRDGTPSELQDPPRDEKEEDEIAVLNELRDDEDYGADEDYDGAADPDAEPDAVDCLRCRAVMNYAGTKELHEGTFRGAQTDILLLEMYVCPDCSHVEFFA